MSKNKNLSPRTSVWLKTIIGLVLLVLAIFTVACIQQPVQITPQVETERLFPIVVDEWNEYILPDASFKYPPTWEILEKIPAEYMAKPWGEEGWRESKMFIRECSGPILQNAQIKSTLIAVEIIKPGIEMPNSYWSRGDYRDGRTRIAPFATTDEIRVTQWKLGPAVVETVWQGDVVQSYSFNEFHERYPNKNNYRFALVYQNDQDDLAESTFDQILSSFRFLD